MPNYERPFAGDRAEPAAGDNVATQSMIDALASRGVRATGQRRRVLEAIGSLSGIFSAERVCDEVPQIGRATVYRTLRLLLDTRAICKVVMPDGEMAYCVGEGGDSDNGDSHHHHAVCTVCGSVRDFNASAIERAIAALSARSELGKVVDHRMEVYDVCRACESKR